MDKDELKPEFPILFVLIAIILIIICALVFFA